jgi:hypothetical protein
VRKSVRERIVCVRTRSVGQCARAQHHELLAAVVVNHYTERHLAQRTRRLARRQRPLRDAVVAECTPRAQVRCQRVEWSNAASPRLAQVVHDFGSATLWHTSSLRWGREYR